MAQQLSDTEIQSQLHELSQWALSNQAIQRTFEFPDFVRAIAFVNRLVEPAESAGHHPDITVNYNKVTISLTTHDAGGLTQADFDLAKVMDQIS